MSPATLLDPPPRSPSLADGRAPLPFGNARLLMALALIASTMLFSGVIGGFIVLREGGGDWKSSATPVLPPLLTLNTFICLAASVALIAAHMAQRKGRAGAMRAGLAVAALGAATFLALQGIVWRDLLAAGFRPKSNNFGGNFYLLTALHFAHAAAGLIFVLAALVPALRGRSPAAMSTRLWLAGMAWHFVDVAWLVIFVLLNA